MQKVCNNAYQRYIRSRPGASTESVKRIKELCISEAGILPQYSDVSPTAADIISRMRNYRPKGVSKQKQIIYFSFNIEIFYTYNRRYLRLVQKRIQ